MVGNITYLTSVSAGNGSTAVLDGSHKLEGDYASLKDQCAVAHAEGPAGCVLFFSETLVHTAVPIVTEQTRYAMIFHFTTAWLADWPGFEAPRSFVAGLNDEKLRTLFAAPNLGDRKAQYPSS
jgi:ectoine hydroxylase-related dioxygenase (phytanoyl-CoA dioxygenase family)